MIYPDSWWNRIKGRVLRWGIAISVLPLLFLGGASFDTVHSHMEEMITTTNFERTSIIAQQTEDYVRDQVNSLHALALTNSRVLVGNDAEAREILLGTLLLQVPYFEDIKVFNANFTMLNRLARRDAVTSLESVPKNFVEVPENKIFAISPISFSENGRPRFDLTVKIEDPLDKQTLGYLQAKVDLKQILTEFLSVPVGEAGYAYFIDSQGHLFGHTDFSKVLRQEDVRDNVLVQAFLNGETSAQGVRFTNRDNTEVIGQLVAIEALNWGIIIEQPTREAYQPIYSFALALVGIVFITICAVTGISILFGLRLVKPLEDFEGQVKHIITTGDINTRIPVQTQDEVGSLVQSFNRLMSSVQEKSKILEMEKELLDTVVSGIGAGMLLLNQEDKIIWHNDIFSQWFGGNCKEDCLWNQVIHLEGINRFDIENGQVITTTINESKRHFRLARYLLPPENHGGAIYLLLLEDVTHRTAMEAKVIETDKMAAIGLLASGVAHEINNPLAIIYTYSEDLLERLLQKELTTGSDDIQNVLNMTLEQINRCKDITGRLLHFARKPLSDFDLFEIETATWNTLALVQHIAKQRNISFTTLIEPNLYIKGIENEWQQVVLNILTNALDATREGDTIEVTAFSSEEYIVFQVNDHGCGITQENLTKVLDPFFTTKPVGKGTGLGLFVSYAIIQRMGGELVIDSTPGEGTMVTITLPSSEIGDEQND